MQGRGVLPLTPHPPPLPLPPSHPLVPCTCRSAVAGRSASAAAPQLARGAAAASPRCLATAATKQGDLTGVVFEPFTAIKSELAVVDAAPTSESYARTDFHAECEAAINEQIK